jgi:protein-disulfide isomerase
MSLCSLPHSVVVVVRDRCSRHNLSLADCVKDTSLLPSHVTLYLNPKDHNNNINPKPKEYKKDINPNERAQE